MVLNYYFIKLFKSRVEHGFSSSNSEAWGSDEKAKKAHGHHGDGRKREVNQETKNIERQGQAIKRQKQRHQESKGRGVLGMCAKRALQGPMPKSYKKLKRAQRNNAYYVRGNS